jgi:hypothetical protein
MASGPLRETTGDEIEATAYFLAAVEYDRLGDFAAMVKAKMKCMAARRRVERVMPWLAGTWAPLPERGES